MLVTLFSVILSFIGTGLMAVVKLLIFGSVLIGLMLYIMKFELGDVTDLYPVKPVSWDDRLESVKGIYNE